MFNKYIYLMYVNKNHNKIIIHVILITGLLKIRCSYT